MKDTTLTELLDLMKAYEAKVSYGIKLLIFSDGSGFMSDTSSYSRELFGFNSLPDLIDKLKK